MAVSLCGAVDLLAAIFGEDRETLRKRYGVPFARSYFKCLNCGKRILVGTRRFTCSRECRHEYSMIPVKCDGCGRIFRRRKARLLYHLNHPQSNGKMQERFFCSIQCRQKYAGHHLALTGFRVHPENAGTNKKWDWEQAEQLWRRTGWGCGRIGQALGIPLLTVSYILKKVKHGDKAHNRQLNRTVKYIMERQGI